MKSGSVTAWEESVVIPTYEVGDPDKNPLFFEKRVYQGSSGKVYPLPVTEKISDTKVDKTYQAVFLENDYLKVMLLPELGGRIHSAIDKTNQYDFVYHNHVIKPALVGLCGPWISGGIEFNWPQHHRPSTFMPVEYTIVENSDGSKTVWTGEIDQMYGTKGSAGFTLYPDKAYIEITGKVFNRTDIPQTFLWWANPAVPVNDHTISVFPPDVHAVMDHGKRAVSSFPIATGEYYKYDYSAGIDISRYKNIKVPTSYMAYHSDYDFIGNYDEAKQAGLLHVADHHVSPGKKQWTWGNSDFGKAWDRNLTDEDGPYIELMTGVFTDNQPDFTWLKPYEEKTFKQYFMPYKGVGRIKNATIDAALNLETNEAGVCAKVYVTAIQKDARLTLEQAGNLLYEEVVTLTPESSFEQILTNIPPLTDATLSLYSADDHLLADYHLHPQDLQPLPEPAEALAEPQQLKSTEELFLAATHIEQYRHATLDAETYYVEGLRRDPSDIRLNNAYGLFLFKKGLLEESKRYFQRALQKQTWKTPNPYNGEARFNLGIVQKLLGEEQAAYDAFYKATWNEDTQAGAFYQLASLEAKQHRYPQALEFVDKALVKNSHNMKARVLRLALLRKLGESTETEILANLEIDALDLGTWYEYSQLFPDKQSHLEKLMRGSRNNYLELALDYLHAGQFEEAEQILKHFPGNSPLPLYYRAYIHLLKEEQTQAQALIEQAEQADPDYCFPNKIEEAVILSAIVRYDPTAGFAKYFLGNLLYDKKNREQAMQLWEASAELLPDFPTVHRNLSFAYYNVAHDLTKASQAIDRAFALAPTDARLLLEKDLLAKKQNLSLQTRLTIFEAHLETVKKRDDLYIEYITTLNTLGHYQQALGLLKSHIFHPWEGGEGKVSGQYVFALIESAKQLLNSDPTRAIELLERTLVYPDNLGEGKLPNVKDTLSYYYLAKAHEAQGDVAKAKTYYQLATSGDIEPESVLYYNDQPADTILYQGLAYEALNLPEKARTCYHKLISYGEKHLFDDVKYDYFAVSLPATVVYAEDIRQNNRFYCRYLIALGNAGLGNNVSAQEQLAKLAHEDYSHQGVSRHLELVAN